MLQKFDLIAEQTDSKIHFWLLKLLFQLVLMNDKLITQAFVGEADAIDNQRIFTGTAGNCWKLHPRIKKNHLSNKPRHDHNNLFSSPVVMMHGTSFHCHSFPCKHCMQMNLIPSCQESIMEETGANKTQTKRDDCFFPYGESPQ